MLKKQKGPVKKQTHDQYMLDKLITTVHLKNCSDTFRYCCKQLPAPSAAKWQD